MAQEPMLPECEASRSQDKKFTEALAKNVAQKLGILETEIDPSRGEVRFEYDPKHTSDQDIVYAAGRMRPEFSRLLDKCSFRLSGRACEACAHKLERKMEKHPGVHRASASYLGGVMSVMYEDGRITREEVVDQARSLGAKIKPLDEALLEEESLDLRKFPTLGSRLARWVEEDRLDVLLVLVAFISMIAGAISAKIGAAGWMSSMFYAIAYVSGGYSGVIAGWQSLRQWTVDIDLLMILAALGAAYVGAPFEGAMLLFLFSFSNVLQSFAMNRTRSAIKALVKLKPQQAHVLRGESAQLVPIESVGIGEKVLIRPGEAIPLDGEVIEGETSVDQSSVTGESMPVVKKMGEPVFAGTFNQLGSITIRVTQTSQHSTISRLIKLVEEAQSEKAKTQRFLDQAEEYYAIGVIGFTLILMVGLPWVSALTWAESMYLAITVMVVASPCAIVISTPASILSAIGNGARRGILFKGGAHLERAAQIQIVALDKTGTLTEGQPKLTDIMLLQQSQNKGWTKQKLLAAAAAVEARSEHPLAQCILTEAQERSLTLESAESFQSVSGKGAWAIVGEQRVWVGSPTWLNDIGCVSLQKMHWEKKVIQLEKEGKTVMLIGASPKEKECAHVVGLIAVADTLRPDAPQMVRELKKLGVRRVAMLTGDNKRVAESIAQKAGVDECYSDLLPADKVRLLKQLGEGESVAMVGDGINDAPALAASTVGIAMGAAGSDVALESADVVLMSNNLQKIPYTVALSRKTRRIMIQNLIFAGSVIVLMVIATLLGPFTGWKVPLPLAVFAHEGGTVLVCLNGLRLLAFQYKSLV